MTKQKQPKSLSTSSLTVRFPFWAWAIYLEIQFRSGDGGKPTTQKMFKCHLRLYDCFLMELHSAYAIWGAYVLNLPTHMLPTPRRASAVSSSRRAPAAVAATPGANVNTPPPITTNQRKPTTIRKCNIAMGFPCLDTDFLFQKPL